MNAQVRKLRRSFERAANKLRPRLRSQLGSSLCATIESNARRELEEIIPKVPFARGIKASALNVFMRVTVLEVVLYKAMKQEGFSPDEIWGYCHYTLRVTMRDYPKWKRRLSQNLFQSRFVKSMMRRREKSHERYRADGFDITYVGPHGDFDFGVDYHACSMHRFLNDHGAAEFAPYVCMSDVVLSEELGWGLKRTQTLADGASFCDFRFRANRPTAITSLTPSVQATVDRIAQEERYRGS